MTDPSGRSWISNLRLEIVSIVSGAASPDTNGVSGGNRSLLESESYAGRAAWVADLSSRGIGAAGSRERTDDVASSGSKGLKAGRQQNEELARPVVAIERFSDALERHVKIIRKGRREPAAAEKEPKRQPPGSNQAL